VDQELSSELLATADRIIALLEKIKENTAPVYFDIIEGRTDAVLPFETVMEGTTDATPPTATQLHYVPLEKDDE